jgi:hypothetical protein
MTLTNNILYTQTFKFFKYFGMMMACKSKTTHHLNFMVTPYINDIKHFIVQQMHTTLKNVELLKHFKIKEAAPTCFGLQGNHHQGATDSI